MRSLQDIMCLVQAHPAQSVRLFAHLRSALPNASHVSMRASKES